MRDLLKTFLTYLRLNRNLSPHTLRAYDSDLSQYLEFLAGHLSKPASAIDPREVDAPAVRGFLDSLHRRGSSRASVARRVSALRAFGRWLVREGHLDADPASLVGAPKVEQKLPTHLDMKEVVGMIESADTSTPLGRRDRAILELFYASGLRLSELVGLDLEDVNLSGRVARVAGKGGKERIVPFNNSTAKAIKAYLKDRGDEAGDALVDPLRRGRSEWTSATIPIGRAIDGMSRAAPSTGAARHGPGTSSGGRSGGGRTGGVVWGGGTHGSTCDAGSHDAATRRPGRPSRARGAGDGSIGQRPRQEATDSARRARPPRPRPRPRRRAVHPGVPRPGPRPLRLRAGHCRDGQGSTRSCPGRSTRCRAVRHRVGRINERL